MKTYKKRRSFCFVYRFLRLHKRRWYFSGLGNLSASVLREIARDAGVHIYAENDTATYINSRVYGVYNTKNEFTDINLKEDGKFTEFFSGKRYVSINKKITLPTGENPAQMLILEE